jgi:uncharacterized Tic20 family protein
MLLGMIFMSIALVPVARVILGIDASIQISFTTLCMWMIAGLMSGLTGMILFVRREAAIPITPKQNQNAGQSSTTSKKAKLHACGLLLYSCIPFANFVAAYLLWSRYRTESAELDQAGKDVLNFQITIYLYLLLSLFLVFIAVGIISNFLILIFHLVTTIVGIIQASQGGTFKYPANIAVVK